MPSAHETCSSCELPIKGKAAYKDGAVFHYECYRLFNRGAVAPRKEKPYMYMPFSARSTFYRRKVWAKEYGHPFSKMFDVLYRKFPRTMGFIRKHIKDLPFVEYEQKCSCPVEKIINGACVECGATYD